MNLHIQARRRRATVILTTLALTAACTSGDDDSGDGADDGPTAPRLAAPGPEQLAEDVRLGDQTDQALYAVDTQEGFVAAVGYSGTGNVDRPLIAISADGGSTWQQGDIDPESVPEEVGDAYTTDVAVGEDGVVAVGWTENGPPGVWSSEDGEVWRMHEADPNVFGTRDSIEAITWSDGRYYAAGTNSRSVGKVTNRPVVWSSEDGETWTRRDLAPAVRGLTGSVTVADVAVQGDQVLVAGGIADQADPDQPGRIVLWRSRNGGERFRRESTPSTLGGDFRAHVTAAAADGGAFHIAAVGDGISDEGTEFSWDGVVVTERYGGWTTARDRAMSSPANEYLSTIFKLDHRWILASNVSDASREARVYAGQSYEALEQVRSPSLKGRGEQHVEDGAAADRSDGQVGLLVGSSSRSGSLEPMIWQLRGNKLQPVKLPQALNAGEPTVQSSGLVHTGEEYVAVGDVADSPVAWSSDAFEEWEPVGLDGRDDKVPMVRATDAVGRGDEAVLAVGYREYGHGHDAMVWLRYPDGDWQEKRSVDLARRSEGGYGNTLPSAVAVAGKKAVIASTRYINGREELLPFFSGDGGESWDAGEGTKTTNLSDSDEDFGFTPHPAFSVAPNGTLSANAVVKTPGRWVIGGERSESGTGDRPAVWLSPDGERWKDPQRLPMPKGAHGASVDHLIARGPHVVATGTVTEFEADPSPGWVSWTSSDGGRTWKVGSAHDEPALVADLVMTKDQFLAVGGVGESAVRDAAVWSSKNGRDWEPAELDLEHGEGRGRQYISSAVVVEDELSVLVADVPPEGGGIYAETVPLSPLPGM